MPYPCIHCRKPVDQERAEFLRDSGRALVCLTCAVEQPRMVLMEYGHKTAGYAVVVPRGAETLAMRAYKRAR